MDERRAIERSIRDESDRYLAEHRKLSPRYGEIAVGGGHFDAFVHGEALACVLRYLNTGSTPAEAVVLAKADARIMVRKWNASRKDYQVHRWEDTMGAKLDAVQRRLEHAHEWPVSPQA